MMMEATLPQRSARHARKSAETDISLSLTLVCLDYCICHLSHD